MTWTNIQRIENLPFEDYLKKSDYHSISKLKQGFKSDLIISDKIRVGKLVDDILTNGGNESSLKDPNYPIAKEIASALKSEFSGMPFKFQVSYFGDMEYEGLVLPVKGRPDIEFGRHGSGAIVDLKVNNSCKNVRDCENLISFLHYDDQIFNYSGLAGKQHRYLWIWSTVVKKLFRLKRSCANSIGWWGDKVLEFGTCKPEFDA